MNEKHSNPQRFKFSVADSGVVTGLASVFGNVDSYGERVVRGAFARSIQRHTAEGTMPKFLWQHDAAELAGRWIGMAEDEIGLRVTGQLNLATSRGRDIHAHVKHGDVDGLSIGYREVRARANGEVRDLLEIDLKEISIVTFPANRAARLTGVKAESAADIERILREGGLPRAYAAKFAQAGWAATAGFSAINTQKATALAQQIRRATAQIGKL
jgi:HK97 family phage prohead protease